MPYLEICLKKANLVVNLKDPNSKPNTSCEFRLVLLNPSSDTDYKGSSTRSRPIKSSWYPSWNEKLWLPLGPNSSSQEGFQIRCFNEKVLDFTIGESAVVTFSHLKLGGGSQSITIPLQTEKGKAGDVEISISMTQTKEDSVIKEGLIEIEGKIGMFSNRYLILRPDGLYYYSNETTIRTLGALQNFKDCYVGIEEEKKKKDKKGDLRSFFTLRTPQKSQLIRCPSEEDRNQWVVALQKQGCIQQSIAPWWL